MSTTDIEARRPLAPLDVMATKQAITAYQDGLKSLLAPEDVQTFRGQKGDKHSFVKRSGWRKIALWCDLSVEDRTVTIDRDESGKPLRVRVVARAVAPSGRYADGEGACASDERRFSKLEHDILATAATRAINRAISNLVGLGAVSAEEMDGGGPELTPEGGPYGPPADEQHTGEAVRSILALWPSVSPADANAMVKVIGNALGYFPEAGARTIAGLAWCVSAGRETTANAAAPSPASGPVFDEMVPPVTEPEANSSPREELPPDEVDVDAIFDAESQFME